MSSQDVQIKETDSIRVFHQKFGDFLESFNEHILQLQQEVHKKLDELTQIKQDIKKEREKLDEEIYQARQARDNSYSCGTNKVYHRPDGTKYTEFVPDKKHIAQCQETLDHLSGHVYHVAQTNASFAHSKYMLANQIVENIDLRTKKIRTSFQNYVKNGQKYLSKAVMYIDQYKEGKTKV